MNSEEIRVGIIGAGANTRWRHIPGLQAIEGVTVVSVCNRSRASSERVAEAFGIPKVFENWQDVISDPETDAVVIGTWPYLHCEAALAALEEDKHVMCEARMAMNAWEAHAMNNAARERPYLVAQVVPEPYTLRVDRTIKRLIAEGYLGDLLAIEVRAGGTFLDEESPLHWRRDFDLSGLNTMSLGIWYEAVMRWVGEAKSVMAIGKTFVKMRKGSDGFMQAVRIPEHLEVIGEMVCGAQMHFQVSSVTGLAGATEIFLFGSEGTLRFSENKLYGGKRKNKKLREVAIPPEEEQSWRVEEEFVNAIRGLEPITHTTFADGVKYMEFTEGVARSVASREAVSLPL